MRTLLLIVGGLLVLVLAALFAVPHVVDWGSYRGTIEAEASHILGRPVKIGGNVEVALLPTPRLQLENVRIAETDGNDTRSDGRFRNPLLRVKGLTIWLAVPPLLSGTLEARSILLDSPEVNLAVDADGRGSWVGLGSGVARLPYLPKEVTLSSVVITNGRLALYRSPDEALVEVAGIAGELSAPALAGPYRFKGQMTYAGEPRDLRLSTGVASEEGLRIKAVVTTPADEGSVSLDGTIAGLEGELKLTGTIEAQVRSGLAGDERAGEAEPLVEVKSLVEADLRSGRLKDLTATFQSDGRPQILTGSSEAVWGKEPRFETVLAAHWLDLDRIAGETANGEAGPWPQIERLAGKLARSVDTRSRTHLRARLEQASLGGETVSGIEIDVEQSPGGVVVKSLSAGLPGASVIKATGLLKQTSASSTSFQGPIQVRGQSLSRLIRWSLPGTAGAALAENDTQRGAFVLDGDVQLDRSRLLAERARLQIAGTSITGGLSVGLGQGGAVAVDLESDELDVSDVLRLPASLGGVLDLLGDGSGGGDAPKGALLGILTEDSRIDMRFGRLQTADARLDDIVARIRRSGSELSIERLELKTAEGLAVEIDGKIGLGGRRQGQLGLLVKASSGSSARSLGRFLGLPDVIAADPRFTNSAGNLRLAGLITLGRRAPGVLDLSADGEVSGGRLSFSLNSDGSGKDLASSRMEVFGRLTGEDGSLLVDNLVRREANGDDPVVAAQAREAAYGAPEPGELSLRASGVPEKGLSTVVSLRSKPVAASFEGVATFADSSLGLEGAIRASAQDAGRLLEAVRLDTLIGIERQPLRLAAVLRRDAARLQLEDAMVAVGEQAIRGLASIETRDGQSYVSVKARANEVALGALLAGFTRSAPQPAAAGEVTETGTVAEQAKEDENEQAKGAAAAEVAWSDQPFTFAALEGVEAHIELDARRMELLPGLALEDAGLVAEASQGRIELSTLVGSALGGKVRIEGSLGQETAGASARVTAELSGLALERLPDGETGLSRVRGTGSLTLALSGKGLSPRGLVTVLAGSGELRIAAGEIAGFAPLTADAVAQTVLAEKARRYDEEEIAELVAEKRFLGRLTFDSLAAPVTVADGTLRIEAMSLETPEARTTVKTALDLQTLALDSEWTLDPKPATAGTPALPGLSIVYSGGLREAPRLGARISADALVRELVARRLVGGLGQLDGVRSVEGLAAEGGFTPPEIAAASIADGASEALDIPEPTVIEIPEPTAPQAISRAAPSTALGGGITIRRLEKSGEVTRQAKQSRQAKQAKPTVSQESRR